MMESFMGSEEFRLGIHNFLLKFSFKNAVTQDLFDELAEVSSQKLDITKVFCSLLYHSAHWRDSISR
jgi:aminopeptidase N